ncbi:MAG: hypothetical protein K1X94_02560, partial [Sandaracinaceae bacterium]|nr:hypothetical protein [Sandaracinaceae bacterium]
RRPRTATSPPPATLTVTPIGGYRVTLSVEAHEPIELAADRRRLRVELRDARNRRVTCVQAGRPRAEARARSLAAGERWSEWLDLRELCWGRALGALPDAREVVFHFDAGRGRGAWVVRTPTASFRALAPVTSAWRPSANPAGVADGAVRISLLAADALRSGRPVLRVRVTGASSEVVRAFVRPDSVSFRVTTPSGGHLDCALPRFQGRALPDFFARLSSRRAIAYALDGVALCGPFEEPGIYEVTPVLTLRERGEAWRLEGVTGTFVGAPAPLRIRSVTYVEQPVGER